MKNRGKTPRVFSEEFKRRIVREIESGVSKYSQSKKYNLDSTTIRSWMIIFGAMKPKEKPISVAPVFSSAAEEIAYLKQQLQASEKLCHYSTMKVQALETLIDVAEEKLKVSIRKKSGTKQ